MPSFEIHRIGASSVDLFINKNSLGEMTAESVERYIACMAQATRRYLFHMNHDVTPHFFDNGTQSLLGYEYPIPREQFHLLFHYPDLGHVIGQGWLDRHADITMYLYERIRAESTASPGLVSLLEPESEGSQ